MNLVSLINSTDNPSGTQTRLRVIDLEDIDTFAKVKTVGVVPLDLVTLIGSHILKPGKFWSETTLEINKNELGSEQQGVVKGGHSKQNFTGFITNLLASQQGTLKLLKRRQLLVMAFLTDGQIRQFGDMDNGARFIFNDQTGLPEGGERGNAISLVAYHDSLYYQGELRTWALNQNLNYMIGKLTGSIYLNLLLVPGSNQTIFELHDGSANNYVRLYYTSPGNLTLSSYISGVEVLSYSKSISGRVKVVISYSVGGDFRFYVNAERVANLDDEAAAFIPVTTNALSYLNNRLNAQPFNGVVYDIGVDDFYWDDATCLNRINRPF